MKNTLLIALPLLSALTIYAQAPSTNPETVQFVPSRYRLYKTENIWTQLLLDTRTGRLWQVSFNIDEDKEDVRVPVRDTPVYEASASRDGRFVLAPTNNMWTFFMLDQDYGLVFHCQFSMGKQSERFCALINQPK